MEAEARGLEAVESTTGSAALDKTQPTRNILNVTAFHNTLSQAIPYEDIESNVTRKLLSFERFISVQRSNSSVRSRKTVRENMQSCDA